MANDAFPTLAFFVALVAQFWAKILSGSIPQEPRPLTPERRAWAAGFLLEELEEWENATSLEDEADALVDLAYVALGRLVEMGYVTPADLLELARATHNKKRAEVFEANATKEEPRPPRRLDYAGRTVVYGHLARAVTRFAACYNASRDVAGHALEVALTALEALGMMNVPVVAAFDVVHAANMSKTRGPNGSRGNDQTDAVKPEGWKPPNWASVLGAPVGGRPTKFQKHDAGKDCRPELIPAPFLWELGRLMAKGAKKYTAENWRLADDPQRQVGAMERHALRWRMGEAVDADTGVHHMVCAAWNAMVLFMADVGASTDMPRSGRPDADSSYLDWLRSAGSAA